MQVTPNSTTDAETVAAGIAAGQGSRYRRATVQRLLDIPDEMEQIPQAHRLCALGGARILQRGDTQIDRANDIKGIGHHTRCRSAVQTEWQINVMPDARAQWTFEIIRPDRSRHKITRSRTCVSQR